MGRSSLAAVESLIKNITRTAHSEALIVRGTGYDVDHLDQPRASLSLSANIHLHVLNTRYDRVCRGARSVEICTQ
jgi:hypothetical protein